MSSCGEATAAESHPTTLVMKKTKEVSAAMRKQIIQCRQKDKIGYAAIGQRFGIPKSTVRGIVKRYEVRGTIDSSPRSGRPSQMTDRTRRRCLQEVKRNPRITADDLRNQLQDAGVKVSNTTVKRHLNSMNLHGRRPRHKPLLKATHRNQRLNFAKRYIEESDAFFHKILWSDETKIELFPSNGPSYVWRPRGKAFEERYTVPTVKHGGGSIMMWGCFSRAGPGDICVIEGRMDSIKYQEILDQNLFNSARRLVGRRFIFQQDNDPKHRSHSTTQYLQRKRVQVLEWPSQSPDLNPIEMLWQDLKAAVAKRRPSNLKQLGEVAKEEWAKIPVERCCKLVDTYRNRLSAVIQAKGGPTKY